MKTRTFTNENGFTAVELLITLFIAAIFLFAGYQLYTQVIKDGAGANETAILSNIVYEKMRNAAVTASSQSPTGCAANSQNTTTETVTGVGSVDFTTTINCPYGTTPGNLTDIFLIKVKASYNDSGTTREVEHATFTN